MYNAIAKINQELHFLSILYYTCDLHRSRFSVLSRFFLKKSKHQRIFVFERFLRFHVFFNI